MISFIIIIVAVCMGWQSWHDHDGWCWWLAMMVGDIVDGWRYLDMYWRSDQAPKARQKHCPVLSLYSLETHRTYLLLAPDHDHDCLLILLPRAHFPSCIFDMEKVDYNMSHDRNFT